MFMEEPPEMKIVSAEEYAKYAEAGWVTARQLARKWETSERLIYAYMQWNRLRGVTNGVNKLFDPGQQRIGVKTKFIPL